MAEIGFDVDGGAPTEARPRNQRRALPEERAVGLRGRRIDGVARR